MDNGIQLVLERLNRTEAGFERWAAMPCPPLELEARLVRRYERLMVVALRRGVPREQVCGWADLTLSALDEIVAERATEPAVVAACAACPEELATALEALDD